MKNIEKQVDAEHEILEQIKKLLPKGYSTNCTTAQQKAVQANIYDRPKLYWCCWVKDHHKKVFFVMYNNKNIKLIPQEERNQMIVKSIK